jgi:quinol monooxygenase YgiN
MISLIATITAKKDKIEEVKAELLNLVEHTRKEEGNLQYALHQDPQNEQVFIFFEQFKDQVAFDFHASQPYISAFMAKADDLLEKAGELRFLNRLA